MDTRDRAILRSLSERELDGFMYAMELFEHALAVGKKRGLHRISEAVAECNYNELIGWLTAIELALEAEPNPLMLATRSITINALSKFKHGKKGKLQ